MKKFQAFAETLADASRAMLIEAARIASEQAGSLQSSEERAAQSVIVDGIIDQLKSIGNRQFQSRYLFAGRSINEPPLSTAIGRVTNLADQADLQTLVSSNFLLPFNGWA